MELITLDDDYQPDELIENYSSLIWTERYSTAGDFEVKSSAVGDTLDLMPLESVVSLRDSTVPMVVEVHKIEKAPGQAPLLTVTGRAFETVLERRGSTNLPETTSSIVTPWIMYADKESDAAYKVIRTILGDVAKYAGLTLILPALSPASSLLDAIPDLVLTKPVDYSTGLTNPYEIPLGQLYPVVMDLLVANFHGIKSTRPPAGSSQIAVEIYNGADLTNDVVFDASFESFDSATYLLSEQASTNVAYVFDEDGNGVVLKTTAPEPSGLDRRVLVIDNSTDDTAGATTRTARGLIGLYQYNETALFDGQISVQVGDLYNDPGPEGYTLGDIVKLMGEYDLSENVRVEEFIRSSGSDGEKAYPTFVRVD